MTKQNRAKKTEIVEIEIPVEWFAMVDLLIDDAKSKQPLYAAGPKTFPTITRETMIRTAFESGLRALARGVVARREVREQRERAQNATGDQEK